MKITLVKKILADGSPCKKCVEVHSRLKESGYLDRIDEILEADVCDPTSKGMLLASELMVDRAPLFIVEDDTGHRKVYTVYFKFVKEVMEQEQETEALNKS